MVDNHKRQSGSAKMRPRARLISLLGDELISDERVALVELVKNAYDADARNVTVRFEANESHMYERIVIEDDGHGMDLDTVVHGWFEPGTITKKKNDRSPGHRLYQGAKGVGRFASARLGKDLFLETKTKDSKDGVAVLLEWGAFDDESFLEDIEITYDVTKMPTLSHGTVLTIEGVHQKKVWAEEDFENLHYRLSRLISPFEEIDDFKINLDVPYFPEFTGVVESHPLTRKPKYKFTGRLSGDGVIDAVLKIDRRIHRKYESHSIAATNEKVECGAIEFEIRAWDRDREGLSPLMLEYDMSISDVRRTLNGFCGVSIYRDGFRVHPYGEVGDDWLALDNRSRQNPTKHLAKNQVIASIRTSREINPNLIDRTTREGLVHNNEYDRLIGWVVRVISVLEEERYRQRPREDAKPEYTTTLFEAFDMSSVVEEATVQLGKKHPVTGLVVKKDHEIRDGVSKLQEHYSRVLMAAGLGQLVDLVVHEIGAPLGRVNRELAFLTKLLDNYELDVEDSKIMSESLTSIRAWLEQIANLRTRLDPKTAGRRGRATSFDVAEEIVGNLNLYENLIANQQIAVSFRSPRKPVIVHMARSNLGQIIANMLDNSVYWLTRHHGDGKGGKISIDLKAIKGGFRILFSDDGPGIPDHDQDRIFEQYFTTKPNGMGLGLFIARQVVEPYGKLVMRDDCAMSGACFEARFERRVGI